MSTIGTPTPFIEIDRENAFLLYATFTGDIERTAHALGVRPMDVLKVADDERWNEKLRGIIELKKSERPGDLERAINRALNFVQAHKFRLFVERVVQRLTSMTADEFSTYLLETQGKDGTTIPKLSTRALADLASALEKAHAMTYLALNDTVQDRTRRKEQSTDDNSGGEMHAKIAAAMAAAGESVSPRAKLFDAQVQIAAVVRQQSDKAVVNERVDPLNNDEH